MEAYFLGVDIPFTQKVWMIFLGFIVCYKLIGFLRIPGKNLVKTLVLFMGVLFACGVLILSLTPATSEVLSQVQKVNQCLYCS